MESLFDSKSHWLIKEEVSFMEILLSIRIYRLSSIFHSISLILRLFIYMLNIHGIWYFRGNKIKGFQEYLKFLWSLIDINLGNTYIEFQENSQLQPFHLNDLSLRLLLKEIHPRYLNLMKSLHPPFSFSIR